jgi:hypothetical protein
MRDLFAIALGLLALFFVIWLYILLSAGMAERRNRRQVIWVLFSLVESPLLVCLLLLVLGDAR